MKHLNEEKLLFFFFYLCQIILITKERTPDWERQLLMRLKSLLAACSLKTPVQVYTI